MAWQPADTVAATEALAAAGYAVLGGEWWTLPPNGEVWPFIPTEAGGIYGWSLRVDWDRAGESWQAYCDRAAAFTVTILRGEDPASASLPGIEDEVRRERPELRPYIWYNLTFVTRQEYDSD